MESMQVQSTRIAQFPSSNGAAVSGQVSLATVPAVALALKSTIAVEGLSGSSIRGELLVATLSRSLDGRSNHERDRISKVGFA
jgi:hypothetical protein